MTKRAFDIRRMPGAVTVATVCFLLLYIPMAILVINAFNSGKVMGHWQGFSLHWFLSALQNAAFRAAAVNSLLLATAAGLIAVICATMAALATTRGPAFRGEQVIYMILNQPLMVPEIVLAIALLIIFGQIKQATGYSGMGYLIVAHSAFCIPFAYMPIRARLEDMDLTLEHAAADLYATPWQAFRRVTLPLLMPGISSGAALAFIVSFDDFTITQLVAGPGQTTLPIFIWSQLRRPITPELNAMCTILLAISITFVTLSFLIANRRKTAT